MFKYLRIAILPLIVAATPITHAMAEGLAAKNQAAPYDTQTHIILVDRYEDIKGCQRACEEDKQRCWDLQDRNYRADDPRYKQAIYACSAVNIECRRACYR